MDVAELTPLGEDGAKFPVVFVVDHDLWAVDLLQEAFTERRINVRFVVASSAEEARHLMKRMPADLLPRLAIVDLSSPDSPGHELMRELAHRPAWRAVPKVVFAASDSERAASFAAGAVEHLVKPTEFDDWLQAVDRVQAYLAARMRERV
jgi:CheY-like chemotaxis protein